MIAEGYYRARPIAAALGMSGTGKEQIAVSFELLDLQGQRLTWYGFFTDDTTDRTIEALRHCGWEGDDLAVFAEGEPLPAGFDHEVEVVVRHETYENKTSARIAFVNAGGGGLALKQALTIPEARTFAQRMRSRIAALDRVAGRTRRPPARSEGVPQEVLDEQAQSNTTRDDDVPF